MTRQREVKKIVSKVNFLSPLHFEIDKASARETQIICNKKVTITSILLFGKETRHNTIEMGQREDMNLINKLINS